MFTEERISEILAVCEKATPEPWHIVKNHLYHSEIKSDKRELIACIETVKEGSEEHNAQFIALARTALPQLAEDYRKLLVVAEAAKELAKELNLRTEVNVVSGIGNHDITIRVNLGDTRFWQSADNFNQALIDAGYGGEK